MPILRSQRQIDRYEFKPAWLTKGVPDQPGLHNEFLFFCFCFKKKVTISQ